MANTQINSRYYLVDEIVKQIQQGEKPNLCGLNAENVDQQTIKDGYTALMTACLYLDIESVDAILKEISLRVCK